MGTSNRASFIIGHSLFDIRYSVQLLLHRLSFAISFEHPITNTEIPISNRASLIIGHSLFDIRYSVQLLLHRLSFAISFEHPITNTEIPISNCLASHRFSNCKMSLRSVVRHPG